MTAVAAGDSSNSKLCFWDFRNFVTRFPYKRLAAAQCAASPLHVMHQGKKRGRPQIRTAEYWREYYKRKKREWGAAHPRIKTHGSQRNTQKNDVRANAALAATQTPQREK